MEKKLRGLIKEAMANKDKVRAQLFKNILEKAQRIAKDERADVITDSMITAAAKKEVKQLEDTMSYCKEGDDRYGELKLCISYAEEMLPKMATEQEVVSYLLGIKADANMGACMKALKEHFGDTLDGKSASGIVKKYITDIKTI